MPARAAASSSGNTPPKSGHISRTPQPPALTSSMPPGQQLMVGVGATLLWMACSSALIILNNKLYRMGFVHPFFVTGMGQVFSALGGYVLVQLGAAQLRPSPPPAFWLGRLAPIILSTAATMFFGNAAYLTLSVAFIQILKAFTPALTLLLCVLAGLERPQWPLLLSVSLIAGGTACAVWLESGTPAFNRVGFLHFMASSVTEAARVVGAEVLLGAARYNSAEALVYIGGPTAALLMAASWVTEAPAIRLQTGRLLWSHPLAFLMAFTMSFLVNLTCFFAIKYTSSLTFKVAGCVKNVAVVIYGVIAQREVVSGLQMLGYVVSVVGFAIYSQLKTPAALKKKAQ
ncbi:hypothetical protein V8C86DRAFT_2784101 [Haematococcus lacustris]